MKWFGPNLLHCCAVSTVPVQALFTMGRDVGLNEPTRIDQAGDAIAVGIAAPLPGQWRAVIGKKAARIPWL